MKIRTRLLSTIAVALFALQSSLVTADDKLNLYTENYPPYNMSLSGAAFAHSADDITGLCTDLVKATMEKAGIDYRLKLRNWATALSRVKAKPDYGLFCAARTEEREPYFHWIGPLADIDWTLYAKPDSNIVLNNLDDARQYRIGGYKDDVMSNFLIERGFNVSTMSSDSINPQRLMLGQIDLWVTDGLAGPYVASEEDITGLKPVLTFRSTPLYLVLNIDSDPKLVKSIEAAFQKLKDSGEADAIASPYRQ